MQLSLLVLRICAITTLPAADCSFTTVSYRLLQVVTAWKSHCLDCT